MMIAYRISGPFNDSYMFDSDSYVGDCAYCNARLEPKINHSFVLQKRKYDVSYTYDGYFVVSERFKDFCTYTKQENLIFHSLASEPNFYVMETTTVLEFDYIKREVEFTNQCEHCGVYEEVIGSTPTFLINNKDIIEQGIYRTDIEFTSKKNRGSLIIMGIETLKEFRVQRFKGLDYRAIFDK